jgi:hypothetical protein
LFVPVQPACLRLHSCGCMSVCICKGWVRIHLALVVRRVVSGFPPRQPLFDPRLGHVRLPLSVAFPPHPALTLLLGPHRPMPTGVGGTLPWGSGTEIRCGPTLLATDGSRALLTQQCGRSVHLITHFIVVPRLGTSDLHLPVPHTPYWHNTGASFFFAHRLNVL